MLQRLHRTLRLSEREGRLRGRAVEQHAECDDPLLVTREPARELRDPLVCKPLQRRLLGRGRALSRLRWRGERERPAGRAEVVDCSVFRDPEEPGRERGGPILVAVDSLEHPAERLARQVLGVVAVAHTEREIRLDPVDVQVVETRKRVAITRAPSLHERALFHGCGRLHGHTLPLLSGSPRSHPSRELRDCNPRSRRC